MPESVLILAGPTASGKTELAISLARRFGAEIVGADSRQIYRGMPIGTAAPNVEQLAAVPHHLIGFLDPAERYSAARFARDAVAAITAIAARGRRAIVTGGTGFYIRALTGGVSLAPQHDRALRDRLAHEARVHEPAFLHAWLALRDSTRAAALDPNDSYRVLRALEVALAREDAEHPDVAALTLANAGIPYVKLFLDVDLAENDARIEKRTDAMLAGGLIDEAERIGIEAVAASAVGYPQALAFLRGWSSYAETRLALARATRRYARRQRAWFRVEPQTHWVTPADLERTARELLGWT
ncbi:MAG TPA: tRNA (adenosine(37)-N6)-dimethylallyltransferase MiaA [Candidatus Baltobacteraceae bacterium]|nr:tRNA (adenosine(37)-N6)-dimethylallyltransferase MiaA [Candidatus Baltobacteraceae bacterium]